MFLTILHCAFVTTWLGALLALFVFVSALFRTNRDIAVQAAPILFHVFERAQPYLAAGAVVSLGFWQALSMSRWKAAMQALILLAAAGAIAEISLVAPRIAEASSGGRTDSPAFRQLHGYSMMIYSAEAVLLMASACLLPAAIRHDALRPPPATSPRTPPA